MGRDYERNPVATMIQIEESYWLKVRHFLTWRDVLIDMTGSRLKTVLQDRPQPEAALWQGRVHWALGGEADRCRLGCAGDA